MIVFLKDMILHTDMWLTNIMASYGLWVYVLMFLVLFCETGLVITPFLPGDSLIFAAGALATTTAGFTTSHMSLWVLVILVPVAAIVGDAVNFEIGKKFGEKILNRFEGKLINRKHIEETESFFDRHGGKTILLARFVPFIRTFAPFVAGIGKMHYPRFARFNIVGGLLWSWIFLFLGFFFGKIPFVQNHFELVIPAIILISVVPMIVKLVQSRLKARRAAAQQVSDAD